MKATEETKEKAKELGIKSWHLKSEEKLQAEIAEAEGVLVEPEVFVIGEDVPVAEAEKEAQVEPSDECPVPLDVLAKKLRLLGAKSSLWKYKHLLKG